MMQEKRDKLAGKSSEKYEEDAEEKPLGSPVDGKSLAGTAPTSPASSRPTSAALEASRPATASSRPATAVPTSRPATAGSTGASRPVSAAPPPDDEEQTVPEENPEEEAPPEAIP